MKHSVFTVLLPDKNVEEVFALLSDLNYDGVELRIKQDYHVPPEKILSSVDKLKDMMARHKLEIPVLATYLAITEQETIPQVFEAADILGAKAVRVSLGPALDGRQPYQTVRDKILKQLEAFVKSIQQFKAKALFEIHFKTLIASPSLAYLLLNSFDPENVGVIFDPANMIVEGKENWQLSVELLGDYLGHVHVKNASWQKEDKWVCNWDDLKSGIVDWESVIRALIKVNYEGYLSNENLKDVILPGATGFIGEQLSAGTDKPTKPIRTKLAEDLNYLKELEKKLL